jgi:prefoldin subunit 5
VNCYKSLQKLNEYCERLQGQLKELEEAALSLQGCWCLIPVGLR